MTHWVYILLSEKTKRFYCGETADMDDRLKRHNNGRSKATKHGIPWKLVHKIECKDRINARLLESKIKKRGIQRWINDNIV